MLMSSTTRSGRCAAIAPSALSPSLGLGGLHPRLAEREAQHLADMGVVVDDQDAVAHRVHVCHRAGCAVKGLAGGRPSGRRPSGRRCGGGADRRAVALAVLVAMVRQMPGGGQLLRGGEAAGAAQGPAVPVRLARGQPVHEPAAHPLHALAQRRGQRPALQLDQRQQGGGAERVQVAEVDRGAGTARLARMAHVPGSRRPRRDRPSCSSASDEQGRKRIGVDQPGAAPAEQQPEADQGEAERDQGHPDQSGDAQHGQRISLDIIERAEHGRGDQQHVLRDPQGDQAADRPRRRRSARRGAARPARTGRRARRSRSADRRRDGHIRRGSSRPGSGAPLHRKARSSPFCSAKIRLKARSESVTEAMLTPGSDDVARSLRPCWPKHEARRPQHAPQAGEEDRPEDHAQQGQRVQVRPEVEPRERIADQRIGLREQRQEQDASRRAAGAGRGPCS